MSIRATLVMSLLATLAHPSTWVFALVGFLLRGGIILVVAPIVVIPSAVGIANVITPTVTTVAFRGIGGEIIVLITGSILAAAGWLVFGGLAAAATEAEAVRVVAADEDVAGASPAPADHGIRRWVAVRILVVRLVAAIPLALALANGSVQVVAIAYRELTVPSEVAIPIALRVVRAAPDALGLIILAWTVSEVIGAIAARRIVLTGAGAWRAVIGAGVHAVRHPIRTTVEFAAPTMLLIAVLVPCAAAAAVAWDATRATLAGGDGTVALGTAAIVLLFVALFVGGLVLAGVAAAWRAAVWTVDLAVERS